MRILVTGTGGLLGLNLALELSRQHTVIGADRKALLVKDAFEALQVDLSTPQAVSKLVEESQPEAIIHCAALANIDACESDPVMASQMNAELPGWIAAEAARVGSQLVHISTDSVFDGLEGGYTEDSPTNPLSVYSQTKLDGEGAVFAAMPEAVVTRVNLFGWSASGNRSLAEFFYHNLAAGKTVKGFTDVYFCPILVNDLADVFIEIFQQHLSGLYHLVSPVCMTKYAFGLAIAEKFGFDPEQIMPVSVNEFGLVAARSPLLTLKNEKLTQALGHALPDVHAGLERFYQLRQQGYPEKLAQMVLPG
jgi:dTDP-4-dehydrorhamnose reductase